MRLAKKEGNNSVCGSKSNTEQVENKMVSLNCKLLHLVSVKRVLVVRTGLAMNVYSYSLKHVLEDDVQAMDAADWLNSIKSTCNDRITVPGG